MCWGHIFTPGSDATCQVIVGLTSLHQFVACTCYSSSECFLEANDKSEIALEEKVPALSVSRHRNAFLPTRTLRSRKQCTDQISPPIDARIGLRLIIFLPSKAWVKVQISSSGHVGTFGVYILYFPCTDDALPSCVCPPRPSTLVCTPYMPF